MKVDEIVEVLASLGVQKDEASVCMTLRDGLAKEYHHKRQTMRIVADNVTRSHSETVARRRFADLFLGTKAPVNHGRAFVEDGSSGKGGF